MRVVREERELAKESSEGTVWLRMCHSCTIQQTSVGQFSCARRRTRCWEFEGKYVTSLPSVEKGLFFSVTDVVGGPLTPTESEKASGQSYQLG